MDGKLSPGDMKSGTAQCTGNCLPEPYDQSTLLSNVVMLEEFGDSTCTSKTTITCDSSDPSCLRPCCPPGENYYGTYPVLRECRASATNPNTFYGFYQNYLCPNSATTTTVSIPAIPCPVNRNPGQTVNIRNSTISSPSSVITNLSIRYFNDTLGNNVIGFVGISNVTTCELNYLPGGKGPWASDSTFYGPASCGDNVQYCGFYSKDYPAFTTMTTFGLYKVVAYYNQARITGIEFWFKDATGTQADVTLCKYMGSESAGCDGAPPVGGCGDYCSADYNHCCYKQTIEGTSGSGETQYINDLQMVINDVDASDKFGLGIHSITSVTFVSNPCL
jgi:hypothetical protein